MILKNDKGENLSEEINSTVEGMLQSIKSVKDNLLEMKEGLTKAQADEQVRIVFSYFGIKTEIEYIKIDLSNNWYSSILDAKELLFKTCDQNYMLQAKTFCSEHVKDFECNEKIIALKHFKRDSSMALLECLMKDNQLYKDKYPNGVFIQIFKLREMGLYPLGVKDNKFICYINRDFFDEKVEQKELLLPIEKNYEEMYYNCLNMFKSSTKELRFQSLQVEILLNSLQEIKSVSSEKLVKDIVKNTLKRHKSHKSIHTKILFSNPSFYSLKKND